jgi:alkanesulfonate monooxygenase SsuD/methylene tetrahydromethanopterin reductase-like flavin-dependent oxidoreductase (luciferase family)
VIERVLGLPYEHPVTQMREYLQVLLPLLKGETVEFTGDLDRYRANTAFQSAFMSTTVQPYFLAASRAVVNFPVAGALAS